MTEDLRQAYQQCLSIAKGHYENFPTASLLFKNEIRAATAAIYAFARIADDIADEGDLDKSKRHEQLEGLRHLANTQVSGYTGEADSWQAAFLDTKQHYNLPTNLFEQLLDAFQQDLDKTRYDTQQQVRDYCVRSANPIGRLMLLIHGYNSVQLLEYSDDICSALQLINFIQDTGDDFHSRDRIYIPMDVFKKFGIDLNKISLDKLSQQQLNNIIQDQILYAQKLLHSGAPLLSHVSGRLRFFLRLTYNAAEHLIRKLKKRPEHFTAIKLTKADGIKIILKSFFKPRMKRGMIKQ